MDSLSENCFNCGTKLKVSDNFPLIKGATYSGQTILQILKKVLTSLNLTEIEEFQPSSLCVCEICYNILDEIDAFEHSLAHAKSQLDSRHSMKSKSSQSQVQISIEKNPLKTEKTCLYMSKLYKRSLKQEPLTSLEHFKANPDIGLFPPEPETPQKSQSSNNFKQIPEEIRSNSIQTIEQMRQKMPHFIASSQDQVEWDMILLKYQVSPLSFGIPNESHCFDCNENLANVQQRFHHFFASHCQNFNFQCSICPRQSFPDNAGLLKHLLKKHKHKPEQVETIYDPDSCRIQAKNPELIQCQKCPGSFLTEFSFYFHHLETHSSGRSQKDSSFKCSDCGKSGFTGMDFKRHILIHHGGFTYACPLCGKHYR